MCGSISERSTASEIAGSLAVRRYVTLAILVAAGLAVTFCFRHLRREAHRRDVFNRMRACTALVLADRIPETSQELAENGDLWSWRFFVYTMRLNSGPRPDLSLSWDDVRNREYLHSAPNLFCFGESNRTHVVAITGPGTMFSECAGAFPADCAPDALDAIILLEVGDSGLHWMEPGDLEIGSVRSAIVGSRGEGISGTFKDGFFVGFADGKVWFMQRSTPFDKLKLFFSIEGATKWSRESVLEEYRIRL